MPIWKKPKQGEETALAVVEPPRLPPCENAQLIKDWVESKRSACTRLAYQKDVARFLAFIGNKPLNYATLRDLLDYREQGLAGLAIASQNRRLSAVKSLLTFACRLSPAFFPVNVGSALQLERPPDTLAERILEERQIARMQEAVWLEKGNPHRLRNYVILRLLYGTAIRRAELCGLYWRHVVERPELQSGQITVTGKGSKTRAIILPAAIWRDLADYRQGAPDDAPVLVSQKPRKNGEKALQGAEVWRIVRKAAKLAGLEQPVSPHWWRHAHASHALDNGAPTPLVRDTGGWADLRTLSRYAHARPKASSGQFLKV